MSDLNGISNGFKIYRPQRGFEIYAQDRDEFRDAFPDHTLFMMATGAVDIVRKRETRPYLADTRRPISYEEVVRNLLMRSRKTAKKPLELPPKRLQYTPPNRDGLRYLQLLLDDEAGVLAAERQMYLDSLSKITGKKLPKKDYLPAVEIGKTSGEPSADVLQFIVPLIPDTIRFAKARFHPFGRAVLKGETRQ
jgi:ribosomal protein L27